MILDWGRWGHPGRWVGWGNWGFDLVEENLIVHCVDSSSSSKYLFSKNKTYDLQWFTLTYNYFGIFWILLFCTAQHNLSFLTQFLWKLLRYTWEDMKIGLL